MEAFILLFIIILLICLISIVFSIVCQWLLFQKMGEEGWKSLIPFYNTWIWCEHTMGSGWWMFASLIPVVGTFLYPMIWWNTYRGFGKDTAFCILGIFFSVVCLAICAFDDSQFMDQVF